MNLLVWQSTCHPQDLVRGEIATLIMTSFDQLFRGFRLREIVEQADCIEHYYGMRDAGGFYFDRIRGAYVNYPELKAQNFSDEPRTCGLSRDLAAIQPASWLSSFFGSYTPPQLCLSRSEQRLLVAAREGATD